MRKLVSKILLAFTSVALLSSCASIGELVIDIQKPAKITLPNPSARIVVKNNSADQPSNINHTMYLYTKEIGVFEIPSNGLGDILVETLVDNLVESKTFEGVFIESDSSRNTISFLEKKVLNKEEVESVLSKYDADILLTLDRYVALLKTDRENVGNSVSHDFYASDIQAEFSLYSKSGKKWGPPIQYRDTLFWSAYSQGDYMLSDPLPTHRGALEESMYYVADALNEYLFPQWVQASRWIYSNATTDMKRANVELNAGKLDEARDIWMRIYEEESKLLKKAWLSSNIALTYELGDELYTALEWAKNAQSILSESKEGEDSRDFLQISNYIKELEGRIVDFELLDLQEKE